MTLWLAFSTIYFATGDSVCKNPSAAILVMGGFVSKDSLTSFFNNFILYRMTFVCGNILDLCFGVVFYYNVIFFQLAFLTILFCNRPFCVQKPFSFIFLAMGRFCD